MEASRPGRASVALISVAVVGLLVQLVALPLWLLPRSEAWGWLLVPLTLATSPFWSLIHETIHGGLVDDRRWNDAWGRLLAIGFGAPFALLKTGHLAHHRYSRTERERTEVYDPAVTRWAWKAPGYYLRLFGGLYLAEVATVLLAATPARVWGYAARRLDSPATVVGVVLEQVRRRRLGELRVDAAAIVLVHGAAAVAYGPRVWMLGLAMLGRAILISVADNAYHYDTRLDAPREAMNLRLPRPLEAWLLAFNLHSVHHRHPGVPWHDLRAQFESERDTYHRGWFTAVARQLRGPISRTSVKT